MKQLCVLCCITVFIFASIRVQGTEKCVLKYAWSQAKPFQFSNQNNNAEGFQIDFVNYLTRKLGCQVNFVETSSKDAVAMLRDGRIDIIGSQTKPESEDSIGTYSLAYATQFYTLFVNTQKMEEFKGKSLQEIVNKGGRIGITVDRYYGKEIEQLREEELLYEYIDVPASEFDLFSRLEYGEIDGIIENPLVAGYTLRERKLNGNVSRVPTTYFSSPVHFVFSRHSVKKSLVQKFNDLIIEVREDEKLLKQWNLQYEPQ